MWKEAGNLINFLKSLFPASFLEALQSVAITTTAELADIFAKKRKGVNFILQAVGEVFCEKEIFVLNYKGELLPLKEILKNPLSAAGANWAASALAASRILPEGILTDIGSTTTDLIPFVNGKIEVQGHTDSERLTSGELVYTGVLRTPVCHLADKVPFRGTFCRVSPEYFSISGDVHVILNNIKPASYKWPTPDGRGSDARYARSRLARIICEDNEVLSDYEIDRIASYLYDKQIQQVTEALQQILSRFTHPLPLVVAGEGLFLAKAAASRLNLEVIDISHLVGEPQSYSFPAWSLSLLLAELREGASFFESLAKNSG